MDAPRPSSRRAFLTGRAALDQVREAADALTADGPPDRAESGEAPSAASRPNGDPARHAYQVRLAREAMACTFEVILNAGQHEPATAAALAALDRVEQLEAQLTIYRDTSEVAEVNRRAAEGPVPVEAGLFALLTQAQALHAATDGAVDVTAGPLVKSWGFHRRAGQIPEPQELAAALARTGMAHVELDADAMTVRFLRPGMELNLGAIGKGYALDRAAEVLCEAGVTDFLWHGGRSSVLARGSSATLADDAWAHDGGGWLVGLADPLRPERRLLEIRLRNQALGTSGATTQFFRHAGRRYGHILDPRTGWPAEGVFSSTALAPTAAEADALATAFYVLGAERSRAYCESHPGIGMVLLVPTAGGSACEVVTAGLAADGWRWASAAED